MKRFFRFSSLVFLIVFFYCISTSADIRYVSKTGSSTFPYTSWDTACDSIQKCLNISSAGDTIYVAKGTYRERITIKQGITLLGSGIDNCIIDGSTLDYSYPFNAFLVEMYEQTLISGFTLLGKEFGFSGIMTGRYFYEGSLIIKNNKIIDFDQGIDLSGTINNDMNKSLIYGNEILCTSGIHAMDASLDIINNNIIGRFNGSQGIYSHGNKKGQIYNNFIQLPGPGSPLNVITNLIPVTVFNNVIITAYRHLSNPVSLSGAVIFTNNFVFGGKNSISAGGNCKVINNLLVGAMDTAFKYSDNAIKKYNVIWEAAAIGSGDTTNKFLYPMLVNIPNDWHLQKYSPLIDAGDPTIIDADGSRSDIGPYGGPMGESYTYLDMAPRIPAGLFVETDSSGVRIMWKKNLEADLKEYLIYRDTIPNFTPSDLNLLTALTDTSYSHVVLHYPVKYCYKIKSVDTQGNISEACEDVGILLTGVNDENPLVIQNYELCRNYPNPFNPSTVIAYRIKERGYVKLNIYDIQGRLVETLVNEVQDAGYHEKSFSVNKNNLASGVYVYRIEVISKNNTPAFMDIKKMILMK